MAFELSGSRDAYKVTKALLCPELAGLPKAVRAFNQTRLFGLKHRTFGPPPIPADRSFGLRHRNVVNSIKLR
jgi:hypothetical protein